ncbi:MAG: threonine ammonia-lyase [Actinomycetes bacterium]
MSAVSVAPSGVQSVSLADIEAADMLLDGVVRRTPMETSRPLRDLVGGPVSLKCENLQRAGSFKIRGAYTRMSRLTPEERAHGVVAASAGNHAQGVALAAHMLGVAVTVFMPVGAALPKLSATRAYGAEVRLVGETLGDSLLAANAFADRTGAVLIHPYDHVDVVAGQGTVGLEILEQRPDVRTVVVCTGGGGLLAGIAAAVKGRDPSIRVVGVQAAHAAAYPPSLAAGSPQTLPHMDTIADGIAVPRPGEVPFALVQALVDSVVTVTDKDISRAQLMLVERAKLVVEPAGAAAVAAILADPSAFAPPVVAVLSGGNIDPLLLLRVLRHGMAAAGRYLALSVRIPDTPGSLAGLLTLLGDTNANVVEVEHVRTQPQLRLDEVEVALQLETRGPVHAAEVTQRLREAGYSLA